MEGSDVCFAPVLTLPEAAAHPHNRARGVFIEVDGVVQPAPAPRFSRTKPDAPRLPERAAPTSGRRCSPGASPPPRSPASPLRARSERGRLKRPRTAAFC